VVLQAPPAQHQQLLRPALLPQQQLLLQSAKHCTCSPNCSSSSNPSMCCRLQQQGLAAAAQAGTARALQRMQLQTRQLLLLLQCRLQCCSSCKRS
jgi:hypothetical protein